MTGILITLFEIKNIPKLKRTKRFNRVLLRTIKNLILSF